MRIKIIAASILIASCSLSCTTLEADNARVNQLQNHNIHKGESKESVISKLGQPTMRRFVGSEETWIYVRDNQRGLVNASAPARMIPIAGIFIAANQLEKQGGQQSANLTVVFNSSGRVKSANAVKTQIQDSGIGF